MNHYFYYDGELHTNLDSREYLTILHYVPKPDKVIKELNYFKDIIEKHKESPIVIYADDEGHFGSDFYGLNTDFTFHKLHNWLIENNLEKTKFYFVSHNLISNEFCSRNNFCFVAIGEVLHSEAHLNIDHENENVFAKNTIEKVFLNYNRRCRPHRFYLHHRLETLDLLKHGIYSYHQHMQDIPFLKDIVKLNSQKFEDDVIHKFESKNPLYLSKLDETSDSLYGKKIMIDDYKKTFLSLVSETECGKNTVYLSEKSFKPIYSKHPFISVSSPYTLRELKKLGYKTFNKWWDESYDEIEDMFDRVDKIISIVKDLSKKNSNELFELKCEMKDVLEYNYNLFLERRKIDFKYKIFNKIYLENTK